MFILRSSLADPGPRHKGIEGASAICHKHRARIFFVCLVRECIALPEQKAPLHQWVAAQR